MSVLIIPIIVPIIAGVIVLIIPRTLKGVRELIALAVTVYAAYYAWIIFTVGREISQSFVWFTLGGFPFSADLRADALSSFILFAIEAFAVLIVIYSIGFMKERKRLNEYYAYILWTAGAASMAVLADNLVLLLIAWEITTALLFYMVTMGGRESEEAAGKTFIMIGFSDCALMLGVLMIWQMWGTLRISAFDSIPVINALEATVYILLLIAALVKAGAMPGHTWIPRAAEGAPTSVMALLPASLDKLLGIYLLARISLHMFSIGNGFSMFLMTIGGVTIILAVMMALVQHDLKKLLAFHAVSQVGYMVMGIGTGVPIGFVGALFHMLNNALYKCCLFLGAGAVEKRTGTTELEKLGGLAKVMPVTFVACLISALAISGVPPFNGFVSKWLIYQGTISIGQPVFLLAAMFGSALTLASFVKVIHSVFLGKMPEHLAGTKSAGWAMGLPMVVLAVLCVLFGVFAQVPLKYAIGPAAGVDFQDAPGMIYRANAMWSPTLATILILVALAVGFIIYLLSTASNVRSTTIFMGGEFFEPEEVRYPGTGFYETIKSLVPLGTLYSDAEDGVYDLYVLGGRYGMKIVEVFRAVHNGIVSTYVAFVLIGLGFLLFYLVM